MVDGSELRERKWPPHTEDAHGLYRKLGFSKPSSKVMERRPEASVAGLSPLAMVRLGLLRGRPALAGRIGRGEVCRDPDRAAARRTRGVAARRRLPAPEARTDGVERVLGGVARSSPRSTRTTAAI